MAELNSFCINESLFSRSSQSVLYKVL